MLHKTAPFVFMLSLAILAGLAVFQPASGAATRLNEPGTCEEPSFSGSTETAGAGGLMVSASLGELTGRSSVIVRGTVESFQSCIDASVRSIVTLVTVAVDETLKARSATPERVTFVVEGGHFRNVVLSAGTMPDFSAGEHVIVFLHEGTDGRLRLTDDFQGKFSINEGAVERAGLPSEAFARTVAAAAAGELPEHHDPLASTAGVVETAFATTGFEWSSMPVTYYVNPSANKPGHLDEGAIEAAWHNAFNTWEANAESDVDFTSNGTTARTSNLDECGITTGDGYNDITWGFSEGQGSSTLATTRLCGTGFSPPYQITDSDIEFDNGLNAAGWRTDGTGPCGSPTFDLESVTLHEVGHMLGLTHPGNLNCGAAQGCPVMNATYVGVQRALCQDDANGIVSLYPGGPPPPTATATSAPTATPTPSPTSPPPTATSPPPADTPTSTPTPPAAATATETAELTNTPTRTPTRTSTRTRTATSANHGDGDVNNDGATNSIDAALILQYSAQLATTLPRLSSGDVNRDGRVDAIDSALVLQFSAGLLDALPV